MSNRRGGKMPLLDHIREFRSRLIKSSFAVVLGATIGWFLVGETITFMFFVSFCILMLSLYIFYQEELKEGLIKNQ